MSDLAFALKMYGDAMVSYYASDRTPASYDNMCFWQQQVAHCAQEVARNRSVSVGETVRIIEHDGRGPG